MARYLYKAAIEADPKLVDAYTSLIHLTVTKDRASDVERYGRHLIAIEPKRTVGYNALTWSFVKQKRWADLDQLLAEAEAAIPDDFMPYYVAANTLLASKDDVPKAERYFRKYLSQEREAGTPSHALAHWRLGLVLEQQGRKADAIAALETAVKADASLEQAKKDLTRLKAN